MDESTGKKESVPQPGCAGQPQWVQAEVEIAWQKTRATARSWKLPMFPVKVGIVLRMHSKQRASDIFLPPVEGRECKENYRRELHRQDAK